MEFFPKEVKKSTSEAFVVTKFFFSSELFYLRSIEKMNTSVLCYHLTLLLGRPIL